MYCSTILFSENYNNFIRVICETSKHRLINLVGPKTASNLTLTHSHFRSEGLRFKKYTNTCVTT